MEEWKDIKDYEGIYQVSNLGRVKSLGRVIKNKNGKVLSLREKILKPQLNKNTDYFTVGLHKNGHSHTFTVHRLVAEAFIPNPENKPQVDHIIPVSEGGTNEASNLRWCTPPENSNNPITYEKLIKAIKNEDRCRKISEANKGKTISDEQKRKQSIAMSGKKHPFYGKKRPEHNAKLARDKFGKFTKKGGN